MLRSVFACALLSTLLTACPASQKNTNSNTSTQAEVQDSQAQLVVAIVLDQMPSTSFLRYLPHLPKDGFFAKAVQEGVLQERVRYEYAGTNTAPGHTTIHTGEDPAVHGIDSNDTVDFSRNAARVKMINNGKHAVFQRENAFASPIKVLKPTIGDLLHQKNPESKVISVSLKARAAVVSGGQSADFVTWYDPKIPGFTTSNFYRAELPSWLGEWNQKNPVEARYAEWNAEKPELYQKLHGPDDGPGESDWGGFGTSFPHNPTNAAKPSKVFTTTPQSVDYLLDMSRELITRFELGADDTPDLLALSISSTDYTGHTFSTESWEYIDLLIKTDRALSKFVNEISSDRKVAIVITSDHGGTPTAEHSQAKGLPGGRVGADALVANLEAIADKELGAGDWVLAYIQPFLYLSESAQASDKKDKLVELIGKYAEQAPELYGIYSAEQARSWRQESDPMKLAIAKTVADNTSALFVVPAPWHVAAPAQDSKGTGHGTPWDVDREVPVIAWGTGVSPSHNKEKTSQRRVAATIASLLGLSWHLPYQPLDGVK